jgi:hypothetical protein
LEQAFHPRPTHQKGNERNDQVSGSLASSRLGRGYHQEGRNAESRQEKRYRSWAMNWTTTVDR